MGSCCPGSVDQGNSPLGAGSIEVAGVLGVFLNGGDIPLT